MNIVVLIAIIIGMFALRFVKLNILGWMAAWWIAAFLLLTYAIDPPIPVSIIIMFMGIITLALLTYLSTNSNDFDSAKKLLLSFLTEKKYNIPLFIIVITLPVLVAFKAYLDVTKEPQPPFLGRTIHPPPPVEISFKGKKIDLVTGLNPYRELEDSNQDEFKAHVNNGRRVYYENCVFCHGDNMEGNGIYSYGFNPIPANFNDPTTLAMLQESYLFWRIAKGAAGLPQEATPWASAMPAWEDFLTEEEIWDVILFLYEYTDQKPREPEALE